MTPPAGGYFHHGQGDRRRKFFWFSILFQNVKAYCVALMVYQLEGLILGEVAFGIGTIAAAIVLIVVLYLLFRPDPSKSWPVRPLPRPAA